MMGTRSSSSEMKVVVNRIDLHEPEHDVKYWLSRSIEERISAVEILRRRVYGTGRADREGIQKVVTVIHRS